MPVIAVDAMGGDRAPGAVVEGALAARRRLGVSIVLTGPEATLRAELERCGAEPGEGLTVVDAPDVIGMHEPPRAAFRRKPRSSIRVAAELVRAGQAAGFFSAGHSGAAVLAAHSTFGMLPGVERPALAVTVPTQTGVALLLDAGANLDCRPAHLVQFAQVGAVYARLALDVPAPRVGLLSVGEEAEKGNDLIREAHLQLRATPLEFIGNVEARDLFTGRADVVVCDGFTGNVALKVGEGLAEAIEAMLREALGAPLVSQIGGVLTQRAFAQLRRRVDYAEYGAAPLLGVAGLALVGHGRSSPRAVESGVALAARLSEDGVIDRLAAALAPA